MTIAELIEQLRTMPADTEVYVSGDPCGGMALEERSHLHWKREDTVPAEGSEYILSLWS